MRDPTCTVEVITPEEFLGDVVGDLVQRRGRLERQDLCDDGLALTATVPLSALSGYATDLRVMTQRRASFTVRF